MSEQISPASGAGILARDDGASIAYRQTPARNGNNGPGVVFLHGFRSDMSGGKALALEKLCRERGTAFLRFDAFGHGESSGQVEDGCISRWAEDATAVISALTQGPQILIGSSLGGWIALLAALRLGSRVAGLIGLAPAPDFTEDLMWNHMDENDRRRLLVEGFIIEENCYEPENPWRIPRLLIEDGRNHLLLRDMINLACPVRLIHGQQDHDVPWDTSLRIADCLITSDVIVHLIKDGEHRLSRDQDLTFICRVAEDLLRQAEG